MSQTITGSQTTVQTISSANATIAAGASVIANGKLGTFSVNNNGTLTPEPIYGAVFAPTSLGTVTIHNFGLVDANGSTSLGPYDAGIVIGGTGTLFNSGTIKGNSAVAMFGTSGSDYVSNTKLIAGSYGVGLYLAGNAKISNSGTIIGTSGTHVNASGIEIRGTAFVSNTSTGTIESVGADALGLNSTATVLNAGLITGYGAGINFRNGGFASNASTGTIDGYRIAVGLYGGGTIINAGHIINTGTGHTSNTYAGIELGSYGNNPSSYSAAIITNMGTITGADYGIDAVGTKTTVTNSGLILSEAAKFSVSNNGYSFTGYAAGIALTNGGSITNLSAGSIIGYSGILLGNTGFVSNAGLISGSLDSAAIFLSSGGTIVNFGTIRAQNAAAIYAKAGLLTVTNSGLLTGDYAVNLGYGGALTNSGTIMVNKGAIAETVAPFDINSTNFTINNSGVIDVLGNTVTGDGRFVNETFIAPGVQLIGGTVTNQSHGTIISGGDGITAYFAAASINNAGTIIGAGEYGIIFGATGTVMNTGLISGYREAIRDKSATATIINSGTIIATGNTFVIPGATSSSNGFATGTYISHGIQLTKGGTVINQAGGTISGQTAIDLKGAGEYVYNAGLVTATGHAGIYLNNTGSVKDTGTIKASSPAIELYGGGNITITNTGLATSSAKSAIYLKQSGTVTNAGTIIGSGPGIQMADGGTVLNNGSITGKAGIAITLASGYVLNQKFVDGTMNTGIYLQDGGSIINTGFAEGVVHGIEIATGTGFVINTGTITGDIGATMLGGGTLTDSGTIIGTAGQAVLFGGGFANRLIIEPGASFSGSVDGGNHLGAAAISTLEFASAASAITFSGASLNSQFIDFASIVIDRGANVTFTGATTLAAGETLTDYGTITFTGAVTDAGLIIADPATMIFDTAVTGPGTLDVNTGDTIIFNGSVSSTETIDFVSSGGTIFINDPSQFNATIINPANGTEIFACFAAGTRILTPRGEIAVENLREGDIVITTEGEDAPVKWIGYRTIDLTKTRHPEKAQPIRIEANAIAEGVPARDLYLSPDHALYFENHLIPAKALLNNRNVTQLQKAKITYYHIELATHAAIFAEHTPCETYLETGNRACFENAPVTSLEPDFNPEKLQAQREAESFAPFCETGPAARALRTKLLDRAFIYQDRRSA